MARSRTLFDTEKLLREEISLSVSNRMGLRREIQFNTTDKTCDNTLSFVDEYIPIFESQNPIISKEKSILSIPEPPDILMSRKRQSNELLNFTSSMGKGIIDPDVGSMLIEVVEIYRYTSSFLKEFEFKSRCSISEIPQPEYALYLIGIALKEGIDREKQCAILSIAKDNLVETFIKAIEAFYDEISILVREYLEKPPVYYKSAFSPLLDVEEIRKHLKEIKYHLQISQQLKKIDWKLSIEECRKAYTEELILRNLLPDTNEVRSKVFTTSISLTSLVIGAISLFLWLLELVG